MVGNDKVPSHGQRNRRASWALWRARMPLIVGTIVALLAVGGVLVFSTSGLRVGGGERTLEEQSELLSSGECAIRGGRPVGRIIGTLTPSRGLPKTRYQVQAIREKKVLQVLAEEVEVVACATLAGPD